MKWGLCEIVDDNRAAQHHPQYPGAVSQCHENSSTLVPKKSPSIASTRGIQHEPHMNGKDDVMAYVHQS
ncbi:hypothetical protein KIN20_016673 [Parelaphostrongylus tenuis]|uniref:Uncharacterized protein n=1 Tax=Parelaphostrongylus tenuis TaxID=148309 RepID=A0AAD5MLY0_PARTN|nr:hypothetical protein KIN20_016673 [Parelaphostrongylus tenuis]